MKDTTDHEQRKWEMPDVSHIRNPETRHEESDVNIKAISWFIGILAAAVVVIGFVMWGMFKFFEAREEAAEVRPPSVIGIGRDRLPPEPRLQGADGRFAGSVRVRAGVHQFAQVQAGELPGSFGDGVHLVAALPVAEADRF